MRLFLTGTPAADIVAHLPSTTLSGIVYLGSVFTTYHIGLCVTPFAQEKVTKLISSESSADDIQQTIVTLYDAIFDKISDDPDPAASLSRRMDRWDTQSSWLGYSWHQTTENRKCVISRKQDSEPLFALGREGFPVLIVQGKDDRIVVCEKIVEEAKKHFTNLDVAIVNDGGNHAPFYGNPGEVMKHIGSFVKKVQVSSQRTHQWNCITLTIVVQVGAGKGV